jgi:single-stranded-DNA-specific exonuclease
MENAIWKLKEPDREQMNRLVKEHHISSEMATLLLNRGVATKEAIELFLDPTLDKLYDPFILKDMKKATKRILLAIDQGEQITIYGDYDVDGITSTSILYMFLKEIGGLVNYYIPDRVTEGYGMNKGAVEQIVKDGTQLIITVDTGITALEEAKLVKSLGVDLIITDHHECSDVIPEALGVINPKQSDCHYPFDMLAGVGVAFKLIQGLSRILNIECTIWKYLDIVAIGTVADIVPLQDENRVIVKNAFKTMANTWNIGLAALMKVCDLNTKKITAGMIGFGIGPRLNAAGRLGDAKRGVQLFTSTDEVLAAQIAEELNAENIKRQKIEKEIYEEVVSIIDNTIDIENTKVIVALGEGFNHGVIGIVASKICEKYYRPTIILTGNEGVASGSARSVEGFSIYDALCTCKDILDKFGGHEMAAGMSLMQDKVDELRTRLNDYASKTMSADTLVKKISADMMIEVKATTIPFIEKIESLEPYGMGNPEPRFIVSGVVDNIVQIGKEKNHIKISLKDETSKVEGILFNRIEFYDYIRKDNKVSLICSLGINEWNHNKNPQFMIKDMKYSKEYEQTFDRAITLLAQLSDEVILDIRKHHLEPSRNLYEAVYRGLYKLNKMQFASVSFGKLMESVGLMDENRMISLLICLKVFEELELIAYNIEGYIVHFEIFTGKKVELTASKLYNKLC